MNSIHEFCEKMMIPKNIESAFISYCKTTYAIRFELKEGDTIARLILNMNEDQVSGAWKSFVSEFKGLLIK